MTRAPRFFNTAGPTDPEAHYCVDPLGRIDVTHVEGLMASGRYFVLHAPRQSGKTTCLLALMRRLNAAGQYRSAYANIESAQALRGDVDRAMTVVVESIAQDALTYSGDGLPMDLLHEVLDRVSPGSALVEMLRLWSAADPRPLVLLLDEVDALVGDALISVLRQLRRGYPSRPGAFPQSVILCGVRDVRDYRIHTADGEIIAGGSAFNVKAESLRLGDFSQPEVRALLGQHTEETGERWADEALDEVWRQTQGQPWLVNALAHELTGSARFARDRARVIGVAEVTEARERLILRRDVHIDQLADKLREARVRRVIEPILRSEEPTDWATDDDVQYAIDLGLVRKGPSGTEIANPIYREVLPRCLTSVAQDYIAALVPASPFIAPSGRLLMDRLLERFQQFYRENSESWVQRFEYREAGPQLLLQAFLQRVVNGGGRVDREYGLGRMRTDLLVVWPHPAGEQRSVIEAKVVRRSRDASIAEGLPQTRNYMDRCGADDGHLILFDARQGQTWEQRVFHEVREGLSVWGM